MSISDYVAILKRRWLLLVGGLVLGLAVALAYVLLAPRVYVSQATLFIASQAPGENANSIYEGGLLSQERTKSYAQLIGSDRVSQEVIARLGLPTSAQDLSKRIYASSSSDTVLITINVSAPSPEEAAMIANTTGAVFTNVVAELERPAAPGRQPSVAARQFAPATLPASASSPAVGSALLLGGGIGLLLGLGLVGLRHATDNRVRGSEELSDISGVPTLASVPLDESLTKGAPDSGQIDLMRGEALRQLRTNLTYSDVDNDSHVVLFTSPRPGDGKTSVTADLARVMSENGSRVCVVEADLRKPRVSRLLSLEPEVGLTSVLSGRVELADAIQRSSGLFDVLACGTIPPNPSELLGSARMKALLRSLRERYDFILLDTPPLLAVTDAAVLCSSADVVLLVVREGVSTREEIRGAKEMLSNVSRDLTGTVLNGAETAAGGAYRYRYEYTAAENSSSRGDVTAKTAGSRSRTTTENDDAARTEELSRDRAQAIARPSSAGRRREDR